MKSGSVIKMLKNTILKYLIIWFPILVSLERFIPIVGTVLTFTFILVLIMNALQKNFFWIKYPVIFLLMLVTYSMSIQNVHHIAHLKTLIIILLAMDNYWKGLYYRVYRLIVNNIKILKTQLYVIMFLNLLFVALSVGYSEDYSMEWGIRAYRGIYTDPHQAAYHFCILLVILLVIAKEKYSIFDYILLFGFEFCTMMTGARVPAALALLLAVIFCLDHKINIGNSVINRIFSYLPMIIMIILMAYIIMTYTSFGSKVMNALRGTTFDNGRSGLRELDIKLFKQSDMKHKLLGYGTDYIIRYHGSVAYGSEIWSHNDFMALLCGEGIIMLGIYCWSWLKQVIYSLKNKNIMLFVSVISCMLVAFFNGLYIHSRFTFIMPMLFLYMQERKNLENNERRRNEKNIGSIM